MRDRLVESGHDAVLDVIELSIYSTSILVIVLLWVYVPA
jgi:hypothetical protein